MLKANTLDLMLCEGRLEPRQWPAVEVWRGPLTDALYEHIVEAFKLKIGLQ